MSEAAPLARSPDPGKWASIGLAVFVHAVLVVLLVFGIRWQNRAPDAVEVELFRAGPAARPAPAPEPAQEPRPQPKSEPKPEPRPEPKAAPRPEPRPAQPPKPDIAVKEKEKPKPAPKEQPKPQPKEEPKPRPDTETQRRLLAEQLRRETEMLSRQRAQEEAAREAAELSERQAAAAASAAAQRGLRNWEDKIRGKIRGNIVVPPGVSGNPEAAYDVSLLPDGTVLSVKLRKSTGVAALDAAIERAIHKSSPLPKPDEPSVFVRDLSLKFRPLEE
jgi:colicin import membrane protein